MLEAKVFMFSRSLTEDYRWIYAINFINNADRNNLLNDYRRFEYNRLAFLKEKYLIVRQLSDGIIFYKFLETKDKDQNSRKIYALLGCMFSGFDLEIMQALFQHSVVYFYEKFDDLFEKYQSNIPEKKEMCVEKIEFDLDHMIDYFRKNNITKPLLDKAANYISSNMPKSFIIKNGMIGSIPWEKTNVPLSEQKDYATIAKSENIIYAKSVSEANRSDDRQIQVSANADHAPRSVYEKQKKDMIEPEQNVHGRLSNNNSSSVKYESMMHDEKKPNKYENSSYMYNSDNKKKREGIIQAIFNKLLHLE